MRKSSAPTLFSPRWQRPPIDAGRRGTIMALVAAAAAWVGRAAGGASCEVEASDGGFSASVTVAVRSA